MIQNNTHKRKTVCKKVTFVNLIKCIVAGLKKYNVMFSFILWTCKTDQLY